MEYFSIEEYDKYNYDHRSVVIKLANDEKVTRYFHDFEAYVQNIEERIEDDDENKVYIVSFHDEPIGVTTVDHQSFKHYLSLALLPEKRHERLGAMLLGELAEYLFQHKKMDRIYLEINDTNIASIKTAEKVGFVKDVRTRYYLKNFYKKL